MHPWGVGWLVGPTLVRLLALSSPHLHRVDELSDDGATDPDAMAIVMAVVAVTQLVLAMAMVTP